MSRNVVFANEEIYHVFNRGIEHRQIFNDKKDYLRVLDTIRFYQYNPFIKFTDFKNLNIELRNEILSQIQKLPKIVEIISYCLMPNHFHFLIKQKVDKGISTFISKLTNSHTKYFNTKTKRDGSLLTGTFKSVRIETDIQLLHVSRYIHLNPVTSYLTSINNLEKYEWSSFSEYVSNSDFCRKELVLSFFNSTEQYRQFIIDQADYALNLKNIEYLLLDLRGRLPRV